jgi:RNA polymerase sigma-70 factor, ECF subfamily
MMNKKPTQSEPKMDFQKLRHRDNEEVGRWFNAFADPVYGFIYYRVGKDPDLAGDVSQETFVTALETIDQFDPARGEMFPWLTYIARNCIRKVLRKRGKGCNLPDFWEAVDRLLTRSVANEGNILLEEEFEKKETAELVRIAMTNLPLRYQLALHRHYFEELSLHEMAALEGSSEEAMKVLLHRSRQAFRNAFETISASLLDGVKKGRAIL